MEEFSWGDDGASGSFQGTKRRDPQGKPGDLGQRMAMPQGPQLLVYTAQLPRDGVALLLTVERQVFTGHAFLLHRQQLNVLQKKNLKLFFALSDKHAWAKKI